jgi:hypothetical protein
MKQYSLFILLAILAFTNTDCKNNPVAPPDNTPGRRDYTWTVDSLKVPNGDLFYLFSLWGSSPTDIWAVGSGSTALVTLWHYDGASWSRNTSSLSSNLICVYGFAQNDVYACDAPGNGVYHFNGQQWSNVYNYNIPGTYLYSTNIWGESSNNIYVAGAISTIDSDNYKGAILHYDGSKWSFVSIPDYRVGFTWIRRGNIESMKYYLSAVRYESTGDTNKIYELDGTNLNEIYSGQERTSINEMASRVYHCIGKKIYKYQNGQFIVWKDFSGTKHIGRIWGRSEIDFFTVASDGLTHYNGTDLVTLYPTNLFINEAFVFQKDIFILCNNRIIIHGKLH